MSAAPLIAVTGAAGAVGSELLPVLRGAGYRVQALTRQSAPLPETGWYDPGDPPDAILHLAADSQARAGGSPDKIAAPHLQLFTDLSRLGWRGHMLFLSSAAVYAGSEAPIPETALPAPPNPYGAAKLAVEAGLAALAAADGLPLTVLRAANIYGTAQDLRRRRVTGLLIEAARAGTPFTLYGDGSSRRDYLHICDLAAAVLAALTQPPAGMALYNIGSGTGTALSALIAMVEAATGRPIRRAHAGAGAEAASNVLDCRRAKATLGWQARMPLAEGLARLAAIGAQQR